MDSAFPVSYAHIERVVAFLLVNFFSFLAITRHQEIGFRRILQEIHPTRLLDLSKPSRTSQNLRKTEFLETTFFRTLPKFYAQTLIVVNLIVVIFFNFLVLTRHHGDVYSRYQNRWKWILHNSRTFLNQHFRKSNRRNTKIYRPKIRKTKKNLHDY